MKKMILAAAMVVSASSAFAQSYRCEVDMIDRYGSIKATFRAFDYNDDCKEGMKECRKEIRRIGRLGDYDCVRSTINNPNPRPYPDTNPYPRPYPDTNPYPGPGSVDSRRMLNNGESAIMNNRYVTVMGVSFNGLYAVRSTDGWNTITNNVRRESLAVTNGCNLNLCVNDSVIDVMSARYVTVVGIQFDDRLITKSTDGWNTLTSNIDRRNLAETKGCVSSRYAQICVGNQVINNQNRYSTVVGIQLDGRVVLRSTDGWNTITTNVDPAHLVITR